jgi:ankyrin repeat protein
MPPGGTIIEIVTPLITKSPIVSNEYLKEHNIDPSDYEIDINTVQEIHMFYHNLAFMKEHAYVGIPNYFRDSDKVKNFIENNEALKEMLAK